MKIKTNLANQDKVDGKIKNEKEYTMVGVGVLVFKDGKVLYAKRKGSHGAGEYCLPGGHLEYMESIEDCAKRETREEAGIEIENIRFNCLNNVKKYYPRHYIDIGMIADWKSGEPRVLEPHKFEGEWIWAEIDNLPCPLFGAIENYIKSYKNGERYFDE